MLDGHAADGDGQAEAARPGTARIEKECAVLRRLSMKRTRSSARRSGGATRSRLPSLNAGSTSRKQAIATRASTIRSERKLAIAATRSAVAQFGCSWRALVAQDIASS